jgi:hypothetical protein
LTVVELLRSGAILPKLRGEMNTEAGKATTAEPVLTFHETLHHYFAMGHELYEAKARGDDSEMTGALQNVVDSLRAELTRAADTQGVGKDFRSAMYDEHSIEKRTLWLRKTAKKLQAAKPALLSLELLGSAGVVVVVAYYVVHVDAAFALLLGLALITLRLTLPWVIAKLATSEERKLRELRRV